MAQATNQEALEDLVSMEDITDRGKWYKTQSGVAHCLDLKFDRGSGVWIQAMCARLQPPHKITFVDLESEFGNLCIICDKQVNGNT